MAGIPKPGSYQRAEPIFDRSRRRFHAIYRATEVRGLPDSIELALDTRGGARLNGRLTFVAPDVLRVQWSFAAPPDAHLSEMLSGPPGVLTPVLAETADGWVADAGGPKVTLQREPWRLSFGNFRTEPADTSLVEPIAEAGGYCSQQGRIGCYETFSLVPGEQLWGLGERFLGPGLRGRRLAHWIDEPFGTNTTDRVYKSVPMVISSRGYGLFFHHAEEGVFDLGATSTASASVLVHAAELDYFVMLGNPKEILRRYTGLTGRAAVPPSWSFGVWMSKCMYGNRDEVAEVLETAARHDIPVSVVGLDPLWLANRAGEEVDFCDFAWNEKDFGPPEEFIGWLHQQDVRLCLWINPYVLEHLAAYQPQRLVSSGRARDPYFPSRAFVDFTGEGARWWERELKRLLSAGVDAFKLDYGEQLPVDARLADGRTGAQVHNLYPLQASIVAHRAGVPLAFTRAGTAGSQRFPLHWSGDAQSTWAGLAGALRGGLAAAWSGFAHWSTDIGGFFRRDVWADETHPTFGFERPEPELYIRWLQFGHLLTHTRYHGTQGREPWLFGVEAVLAARDFARLRQRLVGYLRQCSEEAAESGCPVLRPMAMEFPDDPGTRELDRQYLLGPDLLVRPVTEPGGLDVEVYIPDGDWLDHFTGARFTGPRWVSYPVVPITQLPLLIRGGTKPIAD